MLTSLLSQPFSQNRPSTRKSEKIARYSTGPDARDHHGSIWRARDAPRARVRAVSARAARIGVHNRPFRESRVTADFARDYGFSTVEIEKFPSGQLWQPSKGQLWTSERLGPRKLYDIYDTPVALGGNTPTGDISGELSTSATAVVAEDYTGRM